MKTLRCALRVIDLVNEYIAKGISYLLLAIIAATVYEVIRRYVFNSPTNWVFEFSYLALGPYFLLLGAYTLRIGGHVNVDIFHARLSVRGRAITDVITAVLFFIFMGLMFWHGGKFAMKSLGFRETLSSAWAPPIYPIKMIIPITAVLMIFQGAAKFIRDLHIAVTGRAGEL